ncbi:glycosyl transferase [Arcobacter sp. CECT 8986]|uniref:glycosyltransferase n=1 Tax=Arcobacter sp. CECT 8986 TaxID=2044507 RepID=UPI001009E4AB|nr:glycosyltransferase [Arcobacter sp. CECT 8986]RXK01312.1 glycosyl transferase [Arcobacter sp. CECT 8986]
MKIVYISRSIIPSKTANSINVMRMCESFASLGHEVTLLAPWTKKLEEDNVKNPFSYYGVKENFKLKKLFSPNIKYLKKKIYSLRCLIEIEKIKPNIVYGRDDFFAFYLAQRKGHNVLFEVHEPFYKNDFQHKMFKKFIKNKYSNNLATISNKLKNIYSEEYNIPLNKILVIQSATIVSKDFNTIPLNCEKFRNKVNVGYIGSLFKGRGIEIIIHLASKFKDINFHVVGGKKKDIDFWLENSGNLENLYFHGFISPEKTYEYRNLCDILVAPYQTNEEGNRNSEYMSPIKIFEYMASKKAIICSDMSAIRETITDKEAILVDNKNYSEWEDALQSLANDSEKRKRMAEHAYTYCLSNFTYESRCNKILDFMKID